MRLAISVGPSAVRWDEPNRRPGIRGPSVIAIREMGGPVLSLVALSLSA
jgi:hypothetical protein